MASARRVFVVLATVLGLMVIAVPITDYYYHVAQSVFTGKAMGFGDGFDPAARNDQDDELDVLLDKHKVKEKPSLSYLATHAKKQSQGLTMGEKYGTPNAAGSASGLELIYRRALLKQDGDNTKISTVVFLIIMALVVLSLYWPIFVGRMVYRRWMNKRLNASSIPNRESKIKRLWRQTAASFQSRRFLTGFLALLFLTFAYIWPGIWRYKYYYGTRRIDKLTGVVQEWDSYSGRWERNLNIIGLPKLPELPRLR